MTDTKIEANSRWHHIWAVVMLFFCIDALTGTPKYFSAAAYLSMAFSFSIKSFNYYESRRWSRIAFKMLNIFAIIFMTISIGRRIFT